ncbi:hypothetical protein CYMTET_5891 [Cymbomonas tetramitiformis]|uniref:Poly(A) RNA polymerase mitochondrial-like central palm domain-containing protein n=1 Tax=Cymbomonas tetramitiformis TaxID=36881 RepID=A0AAE0LJ14_9CHLO|nr:hypothetical protein CYMTET_5891 [Cymbomonas tetramitiformis]
MQGLVSAAYGSDDDEDQESDAWCVDGSKREVNGAELIKTTNRALKTRSRSRSRSRSRKLGQKAVRRHGRSSSSGNSDRSRNRKRDRERHSTRRSHRVTRSRAGRRRSNSSRRDQDSKVTGRSDLDSLSSSSDRGWSSGDRTRRQSRRKDKNSQNSYSSSSSDEEHTRREGKRRRSSSRSSSYKSSSQCEGASWSRSPPLRRRSVSPCARCGAAPPCEHKSNLARLICPCRLCCAHNLEIPAARNPASTARSGRESQGDGEEQEVRPAWLPADVPPTLHAELVALADAVVPSASERAARAALATRVGDVAKSQSELLGAILGVHIYGSEATGLATFASDVDLRLELGPAASDSARRAERLRYLRREAGSEAPQAAPGHREALRTVQRALQRHRWVHRLEAKLSARVPILSFLDRVSGAAVDVSITGGIDGAQPPEPSLQCYCEVDGFKPLLLALKLLTAQHGLDKPFTGGVGSFKLGVLLGEHLSKQRDAGRDWGEALRSFATWLVKCFDPQMHTVTLVGKNGRRDLVNFTSVQCKSKLCTVLRHALQADARLKRRAESIDQSANALKEKGSVSPGEFLGCWIVLDPLIHARLLLQDPVRDS